MELKTLGFSDIGDILDFSGDTLCTRNPSTIPESARRAVSSIKVRRRMEGQGDEAQVVEVLEFKLHDKIAALSKLAAHLPGFIAPTRNQVRMEEIDAEIERELARVAGQTAR